MATLGELPEDFIEQVKETLEKLYDFQALQGSLLTQQFDSQKADPTTTGAHQLRGQLIDEVAAQQRHARQVK